MPKSKKKYQKTREGSVDAKGRNQHAQGRLALKVSPNSSKTLKKKRAKKQQSQQNVTLEKQSFPKQPATNKAVGKAKKLSRKKNRKKITKAPKRQIGTDIGWWIPYANILLLVTNAKEGDDDIVAQPRKMRPSTLGRQDLPYEKANRLSRFCNRRSKTAGETKGERKAARLPRTNEKFGVVPPLTNQARQTLEKRGRCIPIVRSSIPYSSENAYRCPNAIVAFRPFLVKRDIGHTQELLEEFRFERNQSLKVAKRRNLCRDKLRSEHERIMSVCKRTEKVRHLERRRRLEQSMKKRGVYSPPSKFNMAMPSRL